MVTQVSDIGRVKAPSLSLRRGWRVAIEDVFFFLFVGGLAWTPFWLGSNRTIAWGINAVIFPGLAALYGLSLVLRGAQHPVPLRRIRLSAVLFAAVVTWVLVQNATWMPLAWQHPIWQLASDALGRPVPGSISVDRDLTELALLRLMTAASAFWLALQLSGNIQRARRLVWAVAWIGAVYAVVGLLAVVFAEIGGANQTRLVSSTFVNRNSFATFAGLAFVAAVALTLRVYREELARSGDLMRLKVAAVIRTTGGRGAVPLALAFVNLVALSMTGSRGGIISTAIGFFVLAVLSTRSRRGMSREEGIVVVFVALLVAAGFIGFGDVFAGRLGVHGFSDDTRLGALIVTIRSIMASPLLGYGYGTFLATFPMFRDDSNSIWGFWDKAHDTYVEIFQGLGLLFGALMIASVLILVIRCFKAAIMRRRNTTIPALAVSVSCLVGFHAVVDFSLQIQAVALTYMTLLGVGVAQAMKSQLDYDT